MKRETITVTKLDAARRQFNTALEMWFHDSDPIATHTLAAAAYQIFHDINTKRGGEDLLYDTAVIKDEYRKEFVNLLKGPVNFLKHADKDPDPDGKLTIDKVDVLLFFIFCLKAFRQFKIRPNAVEATFIMWITVHHPNWVNAKHLEGVSNGVPIEGVAQVRGLPKQEFFDNVIQVFERLHAAGRI